VEDHPAGQQEKKEPVLSFNIGNKAKTVKTKRCVRAGMPGPNWSRELRDGCSFSFHDGCPRIASVTVALTHQSPGPGPGKKP